jgi:hypothetical protein
MLCRLYAVLPSISADDLEAWTGLPANAAVGSLRTHRYERVLKKGLEMVVRIELLR